MKKIYYLALSLTFFGLSAQNLTEQVDNGYQVDLSKKASIYTQNQTTTNGIVSDVLSNGNYVISADDFTLTSNAKVSSIAVLGFQNASTLATVENGVRLYIYTDNNGVPSNTAVATVDLAKGDANYTMVSPSASYYIFNVNIEGALGSAVNLDANTKYWLAFAPKVNLTAYTGTTRWNWTAGDVVGSQAMLKDPANAFGAGATDWTPIYNLTQTDALNGLAFDISGEFLGVDNYTKIKDVVVTVDKSTNNLYVFYKNGKIDNVEILSMDGKKVLSSKSSVLSTSSLAKGVYIAKVKGTDGVEKTTKFIVQ